ncbi:MAG: tRNA (N(6)-L-threonylcarbamoyladenosine(37)-C(2))-methylthiotransferase MtaB [Oscillospiraceae bacterium]|nr:tRNA (N(6)-L-threonylcarbamoyladenosine(37)-C(2))-methylthiotransferase MtaB [Oscillospiraceae bacterium]
MKISFFTLGCKVNQYESQALSQMFENNGFEIVDCDNKADVYIINSCTVTATGDKKTRQIIHRLKQKNKDAMIVLTGCFPQAFPERASKILEADIITGNKNKNKIFDLVLERLEQTKTQNLAQKKYILPNDQDKTFEKMSVSKFRDKTRAFIKIQDGCNRFCSYCVIPKARGRVRSKLLEDIKLEATSLANNNHQEIVLTGINLSSYGQDINLRLIDAVEAVSKIENIKRVRLSSLEPELLTLEDIKKLSQIKKFCPQFHLCLQSGCDETLTRMNRHYSTEEYFNIIKIIRDNFDNASITTDLMVGFPGETEREFEKTCEFIKKVKFSRIHVFAYSKRDGTRAALMKDQIPKNIKHERSLKIIKIATQLQQEFLKSQINKNLEVLFETHVDNNNLKNLYQGYSKNYTRVVVDSEKNICGQIKKIKIIDTKDDYCKGIII